MVQSEAKGILSQPYASFHTWEWEPKVVQEKGCEFSRFSNNSYCQLMRNKTVAIVGDSISFDHYLSFSHLLGVLSALPQAMNKNAILTSQVCSDSSLVIDKRDFHLNYVQEIVDEYFPDVLVLNRGAHYVDSDQFLHHMVNRVFPILNGWQHKCTMNNRECLLVWRTTVPGHPTCEQYSEPSNSLAEMEDLVRNKSINSSYNWDKFSNQNVIILDALDQANITHEVMDAYFVNILRPDLHQGVDCLHTVSCVLSYLAH